MISDNFIIIPQNPATLIMEFKDDEFVEYDILPCGYKSESIISEDRILVSNYNKKLFIILDLELNRIHEFKTFGELNCIVSQKGNCYLAGMRDKIEKNPFYFIDIKAKNPQLIPITLPVPFKEGKAIDDLAITDTELVLFDNILIPKYIITYDIRGFRLDWKKIEKLNDLGTYAHIIRGLQNNNWRVILYNTVGRSHWDRGLLISGKKNYSRIFNLHEERGIHLTGKNSTFQCSNKIKDIAIHEDVLFLLTDTHLSKVDLIDFENADPQIITNNDSFEKIKLFKDSHVFMISDTDFKVVEI